MTSHPSSAAVGSAFFAFVSDASFQLALRSSLSSAVSEQGPPVVILGEQLLHSFLSTSCAV
jgi:hypothetical protein